MKNENYEIFQSHLSKLILAKYKSAKKILTLY